MICFKLEEIQFKVFCLQGKNLVVGGHDKGKRLNPCQARRREKRWGVWNKVNSKGNPQGSSLKRPHLRRAYSAKTAHQSVNPPINIESHHSLNVCLRIHVYLGEVWLSDMTQTIVKFILWSPYLHKSLTTYFQSKNCLRIEFRHLTCFIFYHIF